ncbi:MAG: hypothetical protein HKN74_07125 [Acidimicrobiia bacterium]|nr:hypothetical protein [Acidimicrobiia bacterium]NNF10037.1 hypothetical protein [Acidimicrobiia bacterium]NNL69256.1 hypothetical protein [Acidimicrobiia bacterium]
MDRARLIEEKHRVQGEIRALRPRVERAMGEASNGRQRRRAQRMQRELERLMSREGELRMAIDRAPR